MWIQLAPCRNLNYTHGYYSNHLLHRIIHQLVLQVGFFNKRQETEKGYPSNARQRNIHNTPRLESPQGRDQTCGLSVVRQKILQQLLFGENKHSTYVHPGNLNITVVCFEHRRAVYPREVFDSKKTPEKNCSDGSFPMNNRPLLTSEFI